MKSKKYINLLILLLPFFVIACKNSNTVSPPGSGANLAYFPNNDGNNYLYSIHTTDSTGGIITGTRSATFSGTAVVNGVSFQKEIDTLTFGIGNQVNLSFFQVSGDSVFFALDTTGLSKIIPDSLMAYISIDSRLKAFVLSFQSGTNWDVFNLGLKYGPLSFNLVNVKANYVGTEQLTLNLSNGQSTQNAQKINYVLTLTIPNKSNFFAAPSTYQYSATAWLVQNIGVVKWQGSGAVFSAFSGQGVNLADTTTNVSENLLSYTLK